MKLIGGPKALLAILGSIVGLILLLAIASEFTGNSAPRQPAASVQRKEPIELAARAGFNGAVVVVTNASADPWDDCEVTLNQGVIRAGYSTYAGKIPSGSSVPFTVTEFTKPDGERFNPDLTKIMSLVIQCQTPTGPGTRIFIN